MNPKPNQVNFSFFTWSLSLFSPPQCSFSKGWDQTIFKWYILCPSGVTWWFQLHHLYSLYSSTGIDHVVTQWTLHSFVSTCPRVFQLLSHYLPSGVHNIELPPEFPHFFVHRLFPRYKEKRNGKILQWETFVLDQKRQKLNGAVVMGSPTDTAISILG